MTRSARSNLLTVAAAVFVLVDILHFADHVRQGRALGIGVTAPGTISLVLAVVLLVMAARHVALASAVAIGLGFIVGIGVLAVHLLPPWGAYSDSYPPLHLDAISYLSLALLSVSALGLGAAGTLRLRA